MAAMTSRTNTMPTLSRSPSPTLLSRPCLGGIPPIAILSAHLTDAEKKTLRETLRRQDAQVTGDVLTAKVFIGKIGTKRRAEFELRSRKLVVEELVTAKRLHSPAKAVDAPRKRRRTSKTSAKPTVKDGDSTTEDETVGESETEDEVLSLEQDAIMSSPSTARDVNSGVSIFDAPPGLDVIWVVKLTWIEECVTAGHVVPLGENLVYKAKVLERPKSSPAKSIKAVFAAASKKIPTSQSTLAARPHTGQNIVDRAKADVIPTASKTSYQPQQLSNRGSRRFEGKTFAPSKQGQSYASQTAHLLERVTSEYEGDDSDIPEPPTWVKRGVKYACQRFTPANGPNEDFLDQLKIIRTARTLINDDIGVRAYSTIIASIAAYPFKLTHPREIARLPGCDEKTAALFVEWKNTGRIQAVDDFEADDAMKVLRCFYDIWGVGAKTARNFYYTNHWTELDDIIEFGWNDLDRVQQIGLKFYDEFKVPIPRLEVEQIASVVRASAVRLRDERITTTIVGGYRRGKAASGDVDVIVSHPELEATAGLVREIVEALEETECITHTLTMNMTNTHRGQQALPFRSAKGAGAGFDTLDKALVVWQDPAWPTRESDLADNPHAKNPNVHRRVDIIVAPWRSVGCAVMGWSGGTTFQRDLRRYAKAVKGWKFDSSGVRSRGNGEVVMLEGERGVSGTPEDAERVVFEGLGLEFVPPEQRCTY
ncbi:Nucleotidyltransferase [Pyrenochaeta sp. DS3sAY3a]|nr:Nucleotidyltransferase [Pyrenochaeta sp. DS3sAY3a]